MDKIFNKTKKVLEGIATKLSEALMTVQGWLIGLLIVIVNFFAGYQLVLYGVLIAVAFDALLGICVARKRGEFILSELLRATIFKLAVYFNLIVVFVFIDKFVTTRYRNEDYDRDPGFCHLPGRSMVELWQRFNHQSELSILTSVSKSIDRRNSPQTQCKS